MNLKEHRIYRTMSEPMRFAGLTIDELMVVMGGLSGFFFVDNGTIKMLFLFGFPVVVVLLKKYKKMATGFSVLSYLHWTLGFRGALPAAWPASFVRMVKP